MNTHRTLVRSTVIAAIAGTVGPIAAAHAETTLYATASSFESAAAAAGLSQQYVETFEENTMSGAYAILGPSISGGVANGPFPTGLDAADLTVRSVMGDQLVLNAPASSGYFPNLTSYVVGTNAGGDRTALDFANGGVMAVGVMVTGIDTFIGGYPDEIGYDVFDTSGNLMTTGVWPAPTAETGTFFGIRSTEAIGSIELAGKRFGNDEVEIVDDIQAWNAAAAAPGDVNLDGFVNVDDLVAVIAAWGVCVDCPEDLDNDGDVDVDDLVAVISNWS